MSATESSFPAIEEVAVDPAKVAGYTREWDFMVLASELLREVASYVCVAACTLGPAPTWTRDQAAVGGNMVRLFKLLSAFLDQTVQRRYETSSILSRLAFESIVNARYLIANFSPELVDSYIRHSLKHERRLLNRIQANAAQRGGELLSIEERMIKSINRAARIAGVSLDGIDPNDRSNWGNKNLREKTKAVGLEGAYEAIFGGMSHNVHGSWHDLYQFHLETDEDGAFTPNLEWGRPRPQPLFALGLLSVEAIYHFFGFIGGDATLGQVRERLEGLTGRLLAADRGHEAYLTRKRWPEI
jgi:hypothetical protein